MMFVWLWLCINQQAAPNKLSEDANNQHQNEKSPTATPSIRILGLLLIQNKNGTTKGILNVWGQEWM